MPHAAEQLPHSDTKTINPQSLHIPLHISNSYFGYNMTTRKADEINRNTNVNEDDNENTPIAKRLKSSPTDLIILVGEEEYEYHCHSIYMAIQSDFIDAALASPMQESQTNIIRIPDISPKIWGLMMKIVDSPHTLLHLTKTTMGDILVAAEKFDKYQFVNGFASCAARVSAGFHKLAQVFNTDRAKAELKVTSMIKHALQCDKIGLDGAMPSILAFLKLALAIPQDGKSYFGGLIFTKEHIKQLAPLIAKGKLVGDQWTEEEILCPLFPKLYLDTFMKTYIEKRFGPMHLRTPFKYAAVSVKKTKTKKITIAGFHNTNMPFNTPAFVGGIQPSSLILNSNLVMAALSLRKIPNGNWIIAVLSREEEEEEEDEDGNRGMQVLWRCPMSQNFVNFPPRKGWVKVDANVPTGSLRVELEERCSNRTGGYARRSPPGND